jgi:hypothetical protein
MTNRAITLPRRRPGTAAWIEVFVRELTVRNDAPASTESGTLSQKLRENAKAGFGAFQLPKKRRPKAGDQIHQFTVVVQIVLHVINPEAVDPILFPGARRIHPMGEQPGLEDNAPRPNDEA